MENNRERALSDVIAQVRGEMAVEKVVSALDSLKRQKIVREFGITDQFSDDDIKGIDVIIYPSWGGKLLLQVKASFNRKDKRRYNRKGIYYLAAPPRIEGYEVEAMISKFLAKDFRRKYDKKNKKRIKERTIAPSAGAFLFQQLC